MFPRFAQVLFLGVFASSGILSENIYNGGFCKLDKYSKPLFPLNPPPRHIPWIWDAVISRRKHIVEVTMISRNACKFDHDLWKLIIRMFPEYQEQMGFGSEDNVYVTVDNSYDYVRQNTHLGDGELARGIQGNFVYCIFLNQGHIVESLRSLRIKDVEIAELSSIQIRCPLPRATVMWDRMRIERILSKSGEESNLPNSTESFGVCPDPLEEAGLSLQPFDYMYKLSVCTATDRSHRAQLVEWIEYHRIVGVEHFFLYDTSAWEVVDAMLLSVVLKDYIRDGIVTVVRWPYQNCVKNMGSGRWINIMAQMKNSTEFSNVFFQPPRAVAQTAALASCFSRFKSTSKWMAHMDDDEFLVRIWQVITKYFNISHLQQSFNPSKKFGNQKANSLSHLADSLSIIDPKINAFNFLPLCVDDCTAVKESRDLAFRDGSKILPRYRKWNKGRFCPVWEGKLMMRTAAIGMFFTHYITLREEGLWNRNPFELSREEAAVVHFKVTNEVSGSVYGARLPIKRTKFPTAECKRSEHMKFGQNASRLLDTFTKLLSPIVERRYTSQLTEN